MKKIKLYQNREKNSSLNEYDLNPTEKYVIDMDEEMEFQAAIMMSFQMYMVNNSSSRKRYASPKAGTELYLDLVFRQ